MRAIPMHGSDAGQHRPRRGRRMGLAGAFVVVAALGACGSKAASTGPSQPPGAPSAATAASAAGATVAVVPDASTIGAFSPPSVTVKAGQAVEWDFQDANPHTVTADDNSFTSPHAGNISGEKFSHTFAQAGTYKYHCFIHPQMLGTVVVQ